MNPIQQVLVTGGAGYVGAILVPKLLQAGYGVKVIDLYLYGKDVLNAVKDHPHLEEIEGDIRDRQLLEKIMPGCDAVIHLACISNDPSFELDPDLGRSINYDAFFDLVDVAKDAGVKRFIYASSSSVYGIKEIENVTEDLPLMPLTDYSRYKALCEEVLLSKREPGFVTLVLRPATVCGYSPRQRLDLAVNILTNHAINNGKITVFGGQQKRPNIHIEDMTDLYLKSLQWPDAAIDGKIFNAGYENHTLMEIAEMTRQVVGESVEIMTTPTDDLRSYHISSEKIKQELGFIPAHTIKEAIEDLASAFKANQIPNSFTDARYYNVKVMKEINFK
ncbi:SDR family oxidoreductase [Cuspidothrix issatschenkoi LEGE 03284]|jgi:nucleoside-diphosphate-sugar epimerase|uniref:NAD-dependent epimerase/dehydratase family protein n=1 Tax=Cuspidothrix issatschenkoi TaxID=230752 RepID=UPI0018811938|nr:SDR family oxidoreductase [Cuspidothrix issatschenkoi]MBE9232315.1 SDR family oxidoreductase [Cuspidothrix issatschenkoi LEGE 03284]